MDRRQFVTAAGSVLAVAGAGRGFAQDSAEKAAAEEAAASGAAPFKALFAPGTRHFGGGKTLEGYLGSIQKAYDFGFRAWEDNWLVRRAAAEQEAIGEALREKEMTMGVSVVTTGGGAFFYDVSQEQEEKDSSGLPEGGGGCEASGAQVVYVGAGNTGCQSASGGANQRLC